MGRCRTIVRPGVSCGTRSIDWRRYGSAAHSGSAGKTSSRMKAHIRSLASWAAGSARNPRSAPSVEQGESLVGDPVDLGATIAEVLPGHRSGLYPGRDTLRDDRGLEMGQRDVTCQVAKVGAGPLGVP